MVADLQADLEILASSEASLAQIHAASVEGLAALRSKVDALLGSGWTGGAASGFAQGWQEWLLGMDDMLTGLNALAVFAGDAGVTYEHTDTALSNAVPKNSAPGGVA